MKAQPRRTRTLSLAGCLSLMLNACAPHSAPHVAPDESRPHMTWEIRTGGDFGDKDLVCSSVQQPLNCVLPANAANGALAKVLVAVHAAAEPTSYLGFMRAPFLEGTGGGNIGEVNVTVKPGDRPASVTVTGRVTPNPGNYPFNISISATQPDKLISKLVAHDATVVVK